MHTYMIRSYMYAHTYTHIRKTRTFEHRHIHAHACMHTRTCTLLSTHIMSINANKYSHCHNFHYIATHFAPIFEAFPRVQLSLGKWSAVGKSLMRQGPAGAGVYIYLSKPCFAPRADSPHGGWPSAHLICNNSKMVRNTMLGIFVKGPWYSTVITTKYDYSTQNSFSC